jgi:hypothetical protein
MEWVGIIIISSREDNLDSLVGREDKGVLSNVELCGTVEDLVKGRVLGFQVGDTVDVPLSLAGGLLSIIIIMIDKGVKQTTGQRTTTRSKVRVTSGVKTGVGTRGRRSASMRVLSVGPKVMGVVGSWAGAPRYRRMARERVAFSVIVQLNT